MVGLCQNHFLRLKFIILIHYIYHLNSLHTYERSQLFILNAIPFCPSFFFWRRLWKIFDCRQYMNDRDKMLFR